MFNDLCRTVTIGLSYTSMFTGAFIAHPGFGLFILGLFLLMLVPQRRKN